MNSSGLDPAGYHALLLGRYSTYSVRECSFSVSDPLQTIEDDIHDQKDPHSDEQSVIL
jgi:hypothetical protein